MSTTQQTVQEKRKQEMAQKARLIEECDQLAITIVASMRPEDWGMPICVRDPKTFHYRKQSALAVDEKARIYLTANSKSIVEPAKPPNGHHKPQVDKDHYWSINWQVRRLSDVSAIHTALLALTKQRRITLKPIPTC